ncbi:hypothetical protein NUACC21_31610 [Scytonema sp. NUACC21]
MGRNLTIAIATILALAIASCSSEGTQESTNPTPPDASASPPPGANQAAAPPGANQAAIPPGAPKKVASQPFVDPVVPAKQTQPPSGAANLIRPTNGSERQRYVTKGRQDPFAEIVGYPMVTPNRGVGGGIGVTPRPIPKLPPLPYAKTPRPRLIVRPKVQKVRVIAINRNQLKNQQKKKAIAIANAHFGKKVKPKPPLTRVLPKVLPQVVPNPGLTAMAPPPPQPELAQAVVVSGVVLIGREPQAIIKVPNEPTSRYVEAGQRLANGVLIKRIEMNEGSEPIVILEQYGIEVAKMVGEGVDKEQKSPTASAGSPVSIAAPSLNPVPGGAT